MKIQFFFLIIKKNYVPALLIGVQVKDVDVKYLEPSGIVVCPSDLVMRTIKSIISEFCDDLPEVQKVALTTSLLQEFQYIMAKRMLAQKTDSPLNLNNNEN